MRTRFDRLGDRLTVQLYREVAITIKPITNYRLIQESRGDWTGLLRREDVA